MKKSTVLAIISVCLSVGVANSEEIKPIPEGGVATKLVRMHIVAGDTVSTSVVEVDAQLFDKLPITTEPVLSAATYRLTADHKSCEVYRPVGQALKVSETQVAIVLDSKAKSMSHLISESLNTADETKQHAILVFASSPSDSSLALTGRSVSDFTAEMQPRIDNGGLILFPVDTGVRPLATSCKCKAFFGCTSGCCTDPTCNIIIGVCQSNPQCKKVDATSNCSCRE